MRSQQTQSIFRGFTLYELMLVLVLFSVIGVTAGRFIGPVVRTLKSSRDEATAAARFDNALVAIRRDVRRSIAIESPSESELVLTLPDRHQVRWSFDRQRHLLQTGPGPAATDYGLLADSIWFRTDGPTVRMTASQTPNFHGGTFSLVCPVLLEGKP